MADFTVPSVADDVSSPLLERAQRRLQSVGKILNHDFPNQLVAIQGLVQLLAVEESGRLSSEGQEYVRRLGRAATRALDMAQGLKVLSRLGTTVEPPERILLKDLAGEAAAEIKNSAPGSGVHCDFPASPVELSASRRPLYQALVELIRLTMSLTGVVSVRLGSERTAAGVTFTLAAAGGPTVAVKVLDGRLEYLLARELVEIAGGTLHLGEDPGRGALFSILVPAATGTVSGDKEATL